MTRPPPAIVRVVHHPWMRIGIGALAFIVTAFAVALLISQHRGANRDRIIGQLSCEVEQLGGRPVAGATCRPSPTPSPTVSRETPGPGVTVVVTPGPLAPGPTTSIVIVPAPRSSSSSRPRPAPSPTPTRTRSPSPSPSPSCTLPPPVCRLPPLGPPVRH